MRLLLGLLLALGGCRRARCSRVEEGCRVRFAYEAEADGKTVERATLGDPGIAVIGAGELAPGLDRALRGLRRGEKRTVALAPEEAFGPRDPAAVQDLPRALFASMGKLQPGMTIMGMRASGPAEGRVVSLSSATVRLDFNHPLAGKTIVYRVEIVDIAPAK